MGDRPQSQLWPKKTDQHPGSSFADYADQWVGGEGSSSSSPPKPGGCTAGPPISLVSRLQREDLLDEDLRDGCAIKASLGLRASPAEAAQGRTHTGRGARIWGGGAIPGSTLLQHQSPCSPLWKSRPPSLQTQPGPPLSCPALPMPSTCFHTVPQPSKRVTHLTSDLTYGLKNWSR